MLQTTYSGYPHLAPGGILAIEDIHGAHYLSTWWEPLAAYLGSPVTAQTLGAVHLYAYLVLMRKAGGPAPLFDPSAAPGANIPATGRISEVNQIAGAIASAPGGSLVVLENPTWPSMFNVHGLTYLFQAFNELHAPKAMPDSPPGCAHTNDSVCTSGTTNSDMQNRVAAVHILPHRVVVEIAQSPPIIAAVRHGTEWVPVHSIAESGR
mmetsp:Transcript_84188/g.225098  ORF Transcript_84188/g.225098 Transcript_84188/m.225098 type:complete len:208 (+) Transcript_84188:533-1156(+)